MTSSDNVVAADDAETTGQQDASPGAGTAVGAGVWVLCRRRASGELESLRAFDDEARARADLELVESVAEDQFWIARVPLIHTATGRQGAAPSPVQALALTWLADGAEAESTAQFDDPVVISPKHVRGFLSVPPEEWRRMEEKGWVRSGLLTPAGAAVIGRRHAAPGAR